MRRILIIGLLAVVGIALGLAYKVRTSPPPPVEPPPTATATRHERDRIRSFWALYGKARTLKLAGDWEEAIQVYRQALELDAAHEDTLYNLANCHFELNQFEEALGWLEKLVEVNPMSHRGYHQLGVIRACPLGGETFDLDAAEASLLRAFEINKEETGSLLQLGELTLVKGDTKRAFELLALANKSNFRAVEGYYLRAYMRWKERRIEESLELLLEALRQSAKPVVVAAVPGEGDTRSGGQLPPTTLDRKRLIERTWSGLVDRFPDGKIGPEALDGEFARLDGYLTGLRTRIGKGDPSE